MDWFVTPRSAFAPKWSDLLAVAGNSDDWVINQWMTFCRYREAGNVTEAAFRKCNRTNLDQM
jgi:hypothetical protein